MEAIGKGLVVEPYLASFVLGGLLIQRAANTEQKKPFYLLLLQGK